MSHRKILARAIQLEVEMMGALAHEHGRFVHSYLELLHAAEDYFLTARLPEHVDDCTSYISKVRHDIQDRHGVSETVLRLIELELRIRRETHLVFATNPQ